MKGISSWKRQHHLARAGIFLITVALIAGTVGCVEERSGYDLIIRSTEGGSVTTPGEGFLFCEEGQVINLMAEPQEGYKFFNWDGAARTVANPMAATTIFTMPARAVTVTATFQIEGIGPVNYYLLTMVVNPMGGGITTNIDKDLWEWVKNYRVWEANRKVFLYPENWLEPELRRDRSFRPCIPVQYQAGDVVYIEATPASNYRFVGWNASAGTFANPTAATTTFTMPAQAVTVTANFEDVS
jgi:uncharacterized repeat protein (TIGR02543 family)